MKVASLPPIAAKSLDPHGNPGTPDPAAVEWLRDAMSAGPVSSSPDRDTVTHRAVDTRARTGAAGMTLGDRILEPFRDGTARISQAWQQTEERATTLQQRPTLDGVYMKDLFELQRNWSRAYLNLDVLSKAVGKAAYTVDSLSRN